jgi:transcriptional regulator with XRE-family HTH domain
MHTQGSSVDGRSFADKRAAAGLTQEQLARRADVGLAYVTTVEGGYSPNPERAPKYRRLLRVLDKELDRQRRRGGKEVNANTTAP